MDIDTLFNVLMDANCGAASGAPTADVLQRLNALAAPASAARAPRAATLDRMAALIEEQGACGVATYSVVQAIAALARRGQDELVRAVLGHTRLHG